MKSYIENLWLNPIFWKVVIDFYESSLKIICANNKNQFRLI